MKHNNLPVVAQVVQHLQQGGIETMVLDLMKHQDFNTLIFSLEGSKEEALKRWPRLTTVSKQLIFLNKQPGLSYRTLRQLISLFKLFKVSAVHTHHIGPLIYGGMAAKLLGVKNHIHTEHDTWHLMNVKRRFIQRFILSVLSPQLVADAEVVAVQLQQKLDYKQPLIIHNGIDTERFVPGNQQWAKRLFKLERIPLLIGTSGRLVPVKAQDLLIKALANLPQQVHLAIAGTGPSEKELKALAVQLNVSSRVHFLGAIDNMPAFYQMLDVFCLSSTHEGLPLSPLEAQACNIPSVITRVGGAAEALCPHFGSLIPSGDIEAMTQSLHRELFYERAFSQSYSNEFPIESLEQHFDSPRDFIVKHRCVKAMAQAYARLINHQMIEGAL
ncbi:glycosyltransferase [Psychrobium sp. 1_MG-2023]|uniref:glycosyltransferase n=1 Tax=Psychrobium sp. 1_MG-2023 TaxID=3062624 RepID=UPI000C34A682|nr:glycosyltransferase [Psychrobium sp. 1_MG-2023]MDP2561332.1 glycosyltransferase [Psychrobium sp. 1_MG-2023]PKF54146.1 glycosyl transferase [Alteromonadales bacterium alter-6D02]